MTNKNRIAIIAVLLIISIGNYTRIIDRNAIRTVEFVSIFVIGALSSLLIREVVLKIKGK